MSLFYHLHHVHLTDLHYIPYFKLNNQISIETHIHSLYFILLQIAIQIPHIYLLLQIQITIVFINQPVIASKVNLLVILVHYPVNTNILYYFYLVFLLLIFIYLQISIICSTYYFILNIADASYSSYRMYFYCFSIFYKKYIIFCC